MHSEDLAIGIIFLSQVIMGIMGNFFLLYHHFFLLHKDNILRFTDVILKHLFIANLFILFSKGVPYIMLAFGSKNSSMTFCANFLHWLREWAGLCQLVPSSS